MVEVHLTCICCHSGGDIEEDTGVPYKSGHPKELKMESSATSKEKKGKYFCTFTLGLPIVGKLFVLCSITNLG